MSLSLENLIDQKIYLVLRDVDNLSFTGLTKDHFITVLKGHEKKRGIWIETETPAGCPVRSKGESVENSAMCIFIPWNHIVTILHFPGREDLEIVETKEKKIGFR